MWDPFIINSVENLDNFLIGLNLGFTPVVQMGTPLNETSRGEDGNKEGVERSRSIPTAIGSLIPRRMTRHFHGQEIGISSPQGYIGRSLSRLIHRTPSTQGRNPAGTPLPRRRPLSLGCSEDLFFDHAAINVIYDNKKSGDNEDSNYFPRSSPSTPSFADEKEVFDMLRQSSLAWEVLWHIPFSHMHNAEQLMLKLCSNYFRLRFKQTSHFPILWPVIVAFTWSWGYAYLKPQLSNSNVVNIFPLCRFLKG